MFFISKKWRHHQVILGLILFEMAPIVAILALTGIASPNLYRTKLWLEGGNQGFNSKPSTILYAYANYRPVKIPMVWSSFNTQFNLVMAVLTMFLLLTKLTMHITATLYPIISFVVHAILAGLWSFAIYIQLSPDTIDPKRPNHGAPWYITKNCKVASSAELRGYCAQAKSTFAVSTLILGLCVIHMVLSVWSMFPTKEQKINRAMKLEEKTKGSPLTELTAEEAWRHQWESGQVPPTPGTAGGLKSPLSPMTPRTRAFNQLGGGGGDLPLRTYG